MITLGAFLAPAAHAGPPSGAPTFTDTPLLLAGGNSEPALSMDATGTMAMTALKWDYTNASDGGTNLWMGSFGSTPSFRGLLDNQIDQPGKTVFGGGDADVDLGATGTLHAATLLFLQNSGGNNSQWGVVAVTCPHAKASGFTTVGCTRQILDMAGADRPWITSDGAHVYISYRDSADSDLIHMQRSDDDGATWHKVGDPVVGDGSLTGQTTFDSLQGQLVADPSTHNVYAVYEAAETGLVKAKTFLPNKVVVARSTDMGKSWSSFVVYNGPVGVALDNFWPTLAVDPTNGRLFASWSDAHNVYLSTSADHGTTWSAPEAVNRAPAVTAVEPALAAYGGKVDVTYYGTSATDNMSSGAVWYVYLKQSVDNGASFTTSVVSAHPNHYGPLCADGDACSPGTRNLLDLFEAAIDPVNGKTAIIYTDDTLTTTPAPDYSCLPNETICPQPQVVLAQQSH